MEHMPHHKSLREYWQEFQKNFLCTCLIIKQESWKKIICNQFCIKCNIILSILFGMFFATEYFNCQTGNNTYDCNSKYYKNDFLSD